jgi:hypothetical protein
VWVWGFWFGFALRRVALLCGVFVQLHLALFPAGGPFLPSLSVNIDLQTSAEGWARPRIGARPVARVATYAPDQHRDALPRQRATLSSQSAPKMKAARERPLNIDLLRETEDKARQPEIKLGVIAQTRQQGYATQSKAELETPNPHTGRETGLNNLSRGSGESANRSPASGTRRDVRARPAQGRVAPGKGNAKFLKRPRDEGGP